MPVIEINVSLDVRTPRRSAEVRAFLDFHPQQGLNSEIELQLRPVAEDQWHARLSVDEGCERFAYRIGIAADPDTSWRMRIRNCSLDVDLLVDGDRLMTPKSWLIGECCVRPEALRLPWGRKNSHRS
jgi:hypothetical protein